MDGRIDGRRERHLALYVFLCLCVGMRDVGVVGIVGIVGIVEIVEIVEIL